MKFLKIIVCDVTGHKEVAVCSGSITKECWTRWHTQQSLGYGGGEVFFYLHAAQIKDIHRSVKVFNFVIIQYFCCMSVDFLIPMFLCLCHCF